MESFYLMKTLGFNSGFYKVYIKENELWFVKVGSQYVEVETLTYQSIIVECLYQLFKKRVIDVKREAKEQVADRLVRANTFPTHKHNFILKMDDLTKVEIHELQDDFKLHLHNDKCLHFNFSCTTNFDVLASYFQDKPLIRTNYLW